MIDKIVLLRKRKEFKFFVLAIIVLVSIFYLKTLFTKGVYLNDTFLKKQSISDETHYISKDIKIIVVGKGDVSQKSSAEVKFILSEDVSKRYLVNFNNGDEWSIYKVEIIDENEKILFEGKYGIYGINSMFLYDKSGKPVMENITVYLDTEYQLSLKEIVELACHDSETIRGKPEIFAMAVLLLIVTIIDIKYPLLFFTLSHYLSVKDPEPTEFYIGMQKLSWIVFSILGVIFLIIAII